MAEEPTKALTTTAPNGIVMPAVTADEAVTAWEAYQQLKARILKPEEDIQVIQGREFKKKSYWRKVATFFNLSMETREEYKEPLGHTLVWHFTVRATAPNGRFVDGVGSCDIYEKAQLRDGSYQTYNSFKKRWDPATPNTPHNVRSTAYTRAYNRAVSDLVGGGEVSAEEVDRSHDQGSTPPDDAPASTTVTATKMAAGEVIQKFKCERCDEVIPLNAKLMSQERYDGHVFCFKHQLAYKRQQVQQHKRDDTPTTGDLVPCEIPGCTSGVKPEREAASRNYNKGHVICYHHSTETDWERLLQGEVNGQQPYPEAPSFGEAA